MTCDAVCFLFDPRPFGMRRYRLTALKPCRSCGRPARGRVRITLIAGPAERVENATVCSEACSAVMAGTAMLAGMESKL